MFGGDGEVVEPTAMSFVACHDGRDDLIVDETYEEQIRPDAEFACNVLVRIVPGTNQIAPMPEGDDGLLVVRLEGADVQAGPGITLFRDGSGRRSRGRACSCRWTGKPLGWRSLRTYRCHHPARQGSSCR